MTSSPPRRPDLLTLAAITACAWLATNVIHEGLGHGLATVLCGGEAQAISTAWFHGDMSGQGPWAVRAVKSAGTFANLLAGALGIALHRVVNDRSASTRMFVWLFTVSNLFHGAGYMMTSPAFGAGDWAMFLEGLRPKLVWAIAISGLGLALSWLSLQWGLRELEPWLGPGKEAARKRRARWFCWVPYLLGGAMIVSSATLQLAGWVYVFSAAAAVFGGEFWLAWMPMWIHDRDEPGSPPLHLRRSWGWIVAGGLSCLTCWLVLGPGLPL